MGGGKEEALTFAKKRAAFALAQTQKAVAYVDEAWRYKPLDKKCPQRFTCGCIRPNQKK